MFAELVLASSSSGGHLSARPPVKLASSMGMGMGSNTVKEPSSAQPLQTETPYTNVFFILSVPCQVCLLMLCRP